MTNVDCLFLGEKNSRRTTMKQRLEQSDDWSDIKIILLFIFHLSSLNGYWYYFVKTFLICFEVKKSFWHAFVNTFESKACDWIKPVVQPLDLLCISLGDKINIEMNAGNKLNVRRRENMEKVSSKLKTDPWLISPWSSFQFSRSMQTWSSKSDKNCSQVQGMIT